MARSTEIDDAGTMYEDPVNEEKNNQWRRILLLVVAITVSVGLDLFTLYSNFYPPNG